MQCILPSLLLLFSVTPSFAATPIASSHGIFLQLSQQTENITSPYTSLTEPQASCFQRDPSRTIPFQDCINAFRLLPRPVPNEHETFSADAQRRFRLPTGGTYNSCNMTVELVDLSKPEESSWEEIIGMGRTVANECTRGESQRENQNGGNASVGLNGGIMVTLKRQG